MEDCAIHHAAACGDHDTTTTTKPVLGAIGGDHHHSSSNNNNSVHQEDASDQTTNHSRDDKDVQEPPTLVTAPCHCPSASTTIVPHPVRTWNTDVSTHRWDDTVPATPRDRETPSALWLRNHTCCHNDDDDSTMATRHAAATNTNDDTPPRPLGRHDTPSRVDLDSMCRFAMAMGVAAYRYGASGERVEECLERIVAMFQHHHHHHRNGSNDSSCRYRGVFKLTQSELLATVYPCDGGGGGTEEDSPMSWLLSSTPPPPPISWIIKVDEGLHLHRLGLVVEIAKRVLRRDIQLDEALKELEEVPDSVEPFGLWMSGASYFVIGGSLAMVFGGSWWDILAGTLLGGLHFALRQLLVERRPADAPWRKWSNVLGTFSVTTLAAWIRARRDPRLNVPLVTLSAVAVQLPGYTVTLGVSELGGNRVVAGLGHLVQGALVLGSLVVGAWLGLQFVGAVAVAEEVNDSPDTVSWVWHFLFVPMLFLSLPVAFQNSHQDIPWVILNLCIAYGSALGFRSILSDEIGSFLSAVSFTITANVWGRWKDRPSVLILLPSIILSVSGSIGFLGVLNFVNGEEELGMSQCIEMLVVAALISGGVLLGSTIVPPLTTL